MRSQAAVPTTQPLPAALVTWASSVTEEAEPAQLQGSLPTALGVLGRGTRPREVGQGGGCWCRLRGRGPRQRGAGAESWRLPRGHGDRAGLPLGACCPQSHLPHRARHSLGAAEPGARPEDVHPAGGESARPPKVGEPRKLLAPSP